MGIVRDQSIKNSISFYIGMLIGAINTVIVYPYVFNDNPEYFGLIQILIAYAVVISTITTFGIPKTFIRFFPSIKSKGQLYLYSFVFPLIGFLLATFFYILFKDEIYYFLKADELLRENFFYILILVFFIGFYDVLTAISRSFLSSAFPVFINEVFLKLYSLTTLILYSVDLFSFSTFIKVYIFGYMIKFILLLLVQLFYRRIDYSFSFKDLDLRAMFSFGLFVLVSGASLMIVTRLDMMMIGTLLDLEQVAFYTVAFFIGNAIRVPAQSIISISIPLISKAWENNDMETIQSLYSKSSINQLIIGGAFFVCIWLNIDDIFSLLPEKFQGGKWVVFYIGMSQLFNITTGVNGAIIVNSSHYRYDLYTNIFLVFITICTNYLLIPLYGINGAAIATAISVFLFNFIKFLLIKFKMNMHPFSYKTIQAIVLIIVIYFLIYLIPETSNALFNIVWKSIIVFILFISSVLYFGLSKDIEKISKEIALRYRK